ncbi:uncharacterized protein [Cicer arietinum]|uniref:Uncharacterized protein LOC101509134 isoform X1 n=1 Tax=Cicer arietinum TaxID=3827 RepID=A0A1S2YTZ5_CICAR|nr:uncharacterized protein LOC101509134 isoform X1 [Cicer arietinum]
MLQFLAYRTQWTITLYLLPSQWPQPQNEELLLAMEEFDFEEKCNEIRKMDRNLVVTGKSTNENDKEELDNKADDDDPDNAEEFEGEEFEQETGCRYVCLDFFSIVFSFIFHFLLLMFLEVFDPESTSGSEST